MNHSEFNFSLQSKKSDMDVQDCVTPTKTLSLCHSPILNMPNLLLVLTKETERNKMKVESSCYPQ